VSRVDGELCLGCEACVDACQFAALSVPDGRAVVDAAACMGCGICVSHCPEGALALVRDASKGEPLTIREVA
jgi:heterodisulfide reductase subunit A-like polyferredoxin